ncbi:MAG: hypothetical protein U5N55_12790 [Cypionkella sp.]|nr:hypothetical protein [Cypionkella sp.]
MIETPAEILEHYVTQQQARSFIAWRKAKKAPLNEVAALRIIKTLAAIKAAGGDPSDALAMAQEHGWQTIKPEWYFKMVAMEKAPAISPSVPDDKLPRWAEAIRSGRDYLCRSIPASAAREMVHLGMVTADQCKAAGVVL